MFPILIKFIAKFIIYLFFILLVLIFHVKMIHSIEKVQEILRYFPVVVIVLFLLSNYTFGRNRYRISVSTLYRATCFGSLECRLVAFNN